MRTCSFFRGALTAYLLISSAECRFSNWGPIQASAGKGEGAHGSVIMPVMPVANPMLSIGGCESVSVFKFRMHGGCEEGV